MRRSPLVIGATILTLGILSVTPGICANEATLVVTPEDGDDETGPSFVISRETYGLRLDQVHWAEHPSPMRQQELHRIADQRRRLVPGLRSLRWNTWCSRDEDLS